MVAVRRDFRAGGALLLMAAGAPRAGKAKGGPRAAPTGAAGAGGCRDREARGRPGVPDRARCGDRSEDGQRAHACRRSTDAGALRRRANGVPGALLAEIDPRPFQAQLLLAEGQQERDRALLENARRDLERYQVLASQDSIARQQYETQRSLVRQYEGVVFRIRPDRHREAADHLRAHLVTVHRARRSSPVDPGNIVQTSDTGGIVTLTQVVPISVVFT